MEEKQDLVVNWFPGHMVTALRMISEQIKLCDAVIYVLDARCPLSSLNPKFDEVIMRKPTLFVLNKADLSRDGVLNFFENSPVVKEIYKRKPGQVITTTLDSTRSGSTKKITDKLQVLLKDKIQTSLNKGIKRTLRCVVIGVTNCGKSTLINNLSNKGKTVTGDKPGVTKTKQWVAATDHLWVLDTPGTLWPNSKDSNVAKHLAYVGSIRDEAIDFITLAKVLLHDLEQLSPNSVHNRFGATQFNEICIKRGYVLKGGLIDEERGAKAILTEFRAGKIGRFNLDVVPTNKL